MKLIENLQYEFNISDNGLIEYLYEISNKTTFDHDFNIVLLETFEYNDYIFFQVASTDSFTYSIKTKYFIMTQESYSKYQSDFDAYFYNENDLEEITDTMFLNTLNEVYVNDGRNRLN
jgi:hypothetical protein